MSSAAMHTETDDDPNVGISPSLLEGSPSPVHSPSDPRPPQGDPEASGGLVYGAMGAASAWWTPIQAHTIEDHNDGDESPTRSSMAKRHSRRINTSAQQVNAISQRDDMDTDTEPAQVEMVAMSSRPRLRKVDEKGNLVWPFELETVLIAGLRKYHATSCRPRPSASRNFNRNKLVAEYIESTTGIKRTTKQIASRIQVLRETWKGKKEFSLVAQPRELSEMGFLPPFEGQIIGAPTSTYVSAYISASISNSGLAEPVVTDSSPGPIRNARRARRNRKTGKRAKSQLEEDDEFDEYQPTQHESTRHPRHSLKTSHLRSSQTAQPAARNRPLPRSTPMVAVSLDPYQLEILGPPQTSLENLLPPSALFFVRNTLKRNKAVMAVLAKCTLPFPSGGSKHSHLHPSLSNKHLSFSGDSEVQILLELDPSSIRQKIESFRETRAQRVKLGSQVQLLQSSAIWDEDDDFGDDAGLIERLGGGGEGGVGRDGSSTGTHRYALELPLSARQAVASGQRQVIVVQNLSLLRVSDSRLIDSWVIIWMVGTSSRKGENPRLELVPVSDIPDGPARGRGRVEGERLRTASPFESEAFSSPELTPSPILTAIVAPSVDDMPLLLSNGSFSPQVASPEGSPSVSSPTQPTPIDQGDMPYSSGRVCTPLSLTLPPVMMPALLDDSPLYVPMPVGEVHDVRDEFVENVHMRSRFSQSQARLEAPEHTNGINVDYPAVMHQDQHSVSIPSILHNYTSPPNYATPPQMASPPPPPVTSYSVVQYPNPRNGHSYPPTHIVSPGPATSIMRNTIGRAPMNTYSPPPVHYHQIRRGASHIIPEEWHHSGHEQLVRPEANPRYEEPSSYNPHPVYFQQIRTPPHSHEAQFAYADEVLQELIPSPNSAGSTSSQQPQVQMMHRHGEQSQPLVEQIWYPVGSPIRGVSPGPSYPYRQFSEAYPSTTRTSFSSSGGRGASVPPFTLNNTDMPPALLPPQPAFHSHPAMHPGPMQYVFIDETPFNANEVMTTPSSYISDDNSGYRFPSTPERPPRSQRHPSYHQLQHAHMMPPVDSSVYGLYQY